MATKYHISNSGTIVVCHASVTSCPKDNFDSKYDAEQFLSQNYSSIPSASTRRTTALQDAEKYYGGKYVTEYYLPLPDAIESVLEGIRAVDGNPLIVGGTVRDSFAGQKNKDFDIEVHGIDIDKLTNHLRNTGYIVDEVGKQFGVLKVQKGSLKDLDISVPRRENRTGAGHRSFEVSMDKDMTIDEAVERRDFTFNSVMYDHKLRVLVDPKNGKQDYENKIMRHVSEKFAEDPLRVLRGFQFASRFDMKYAPETAEICKSLRKEYDDLSVERVRDEWEKFFTKGDKLSTGIKALQESGWDDISPGLRDVLKDENVSQSLDKLNSLPKNQRVIFGAAIISRKMSEDDKKNFLNISVTGQREQRSAKVLSEITDESLSDTYKRKKAALRLSKSGVSLRDYKTFSALTGGSTGVGLANLGIREGVGDKPEPDFINGQDILSKTDKNPGPWTGKVLSELRDLQYLGALENRSAALSYLDEVLGKIE